jgi:anti-sigma B factor antagonist
MYIHTEKHGDVAVIVPDKNKLLGIEAAEIQNTLMELIDNGSKTIAVDLTPVDYLTSWGIGILIHAFTSCTNRDIRFYLFGVNDKVMDILRKVRLENIFDIRENV